MERVDTSDLQADLAFEGARGWGKDEACTGQVWALETAERLGLVPRHDFRLAETSVGKKELEILRQRRASGSFMWVVMEPPGQSVESWYVYRHAGKYVAPECKLPEGGDAVYALWLRELVKGVKWDDLTQKERIAIAQQLHEEVAQGLSSMLNIRERIRAERLKGSSFSASSTELVREFFRMAREWQPSRQLLEQVGLSKDAEEAKPKIKKGETKKK